MNKDVSVTSTRRQRQETFWAWMDATIRQLAGDLIARTLDIEMEVHLQAGWNQRAKTRLGYRNGHYRRKLMTPHGVLDVNIPRCRSGPLDSSAVFDRYQRRITDVDRILRHAYLLGASTRGTAQLAEQVFGGTVSHQTVSKLMKVAGRRGDVRLRRGWSDPVGLGAGLSGSSLAELHVPSTLSPAEQCGPHELP